jgi:hypothetical protein
MVSTVKKPQATIPVACWHRNARHVAAPSRGRIDPMTSHRCADRGCRDLHAQPKQFALDALMPSEDSRGLGG